MLLRIIIISVIAQLQWTHCSNQSSRSVSPTTPKEALTPPPSSAAAASSAPSGISTGSIPVTASPKTPAKASSSSASAASAIHYTPSSRPAAFEEIAGSPYAGKAFFDFARIDLSAAKTLNNQLNTQDIRSIYDISSILFFAQQAAEKGFKAELFGNEAFSELATTHNLVNLAQELVKRFPDHRNLVSQAKLLLPYQNSPRYPDVNLSPELHALSDQLNEALSSNNQDLLIKTQTKLKEIANDAVEAANDVINNANKNLITPSKTGEPREVMRRFQSPKPTKKLNFAQLTVEGATTSSPISSPSASSSASAAAAASPKVKVPNIELQKWLDSSKNDIESAKILAQSGTIIGATTHEGNILSLAQQAVEKLLKAYLHALKINFKATHDVEKLANEIAQRQIKPILIAKEKLAKSLAPGMKSPPSKTKNIAQRELTSEEIQEHADVQMKIILDKAKELQSAYLEARYPMQKPVVFKLSSAEALKIAQDTYEYIVEQIKAINPSAKK